MPTAETFNAQLSSMNPEAFNCNSFSPSMVPNIFSTQTGAFERIPALEDYLEKDKPRMEYGSSRMKVGSVITMGIWGVLRDITTDCDSLQTSVRTSDL